MRRDFTVDPDDRLTIPKQLPVFFKRIQNAFNLSSNDTEVAKLGRMPVLNPLVPGVQDVFASKSRNFGRIAGPKANYTREMPSACFSDFHFSFRSEK
jgi:hypothetical protein